MTNSFISSIFFILSFQLCAQNLVLDPSFESAQHGLHQGTWVGIRGTPDLWDGENEEDNLNFGLCKSVRPYKGDRIVGLVLVNTDRWNCMGREFLHGELAVPLEKGRQYSLSMKVRKADLVGEYSLEDIGVLFTEQKPTIKDVCGQRVRFKSLTANTKQISDNSQWQNIEAEFTADGGEKYLILGGFLGASFDALSKESNNRNVQSYYFFDDINLLPIDTKKSNFFDNNSVARREKFTIQSTNIILFDYNSSEIKQDDFPNLKEIARILKESNNLSLQISGHTDNIGGDKYNLKLSRDRASNVKEHLLQLGVLSSQIEEVWKGSYESIASNQGEEGRQINRRVEIKFLYNDELDEFQIMALRDFALFYGYVRFFHPKKFLENFDWNILAAEGVQKIRAIHNQEDFVLMLNKLFYEIAPSVAFCIHDSCEIKEEISDDYYFWQHLGLACGGNDVFQSKIVNSREKQQWLFDQSPSKNDIIEKGITGVQAVIPVIVSASKFDKNIELPNSILDFPILDQDKYLANTIIIWNIVQHFYPYLATLNINWKENLEFFLLESAKIDDILECTNYLKRMITSIKDGHADVSHISEYGDIKLPFKLGLFDNKFKVIESNYDRVRVGDNIISIDGEPLNVLFDRDTSLISGSVQWKKFKALEFLGSKKKGFRNTILLERNSRTIEIDVKKNVVQKRSDETIKEIRNNIFYVDLTNVYNVDTLLQDLSILENANHIIFDVRGYLNFSLTKLFPLLMSVQDTSSNWLSTPQISGSNQHKLNFKTEGWNLKPSLSRLPGEYIFLTNGGTISASESFIAFVKYYKLGTIFGTNTAGANGSRNWIDLLLGYNFSWTGMYATELDGVTCYHHEGLKPDVLLNEELTNSDKIFDFVLDYIKNEY